MTSIPVPDELPPALARWLAPYVAEELRRQGAGAPAAPMYDDATCAVYVRELGTGVLNRAHDFFLKLAEDGQIGSLALAQHLSIGTPRNIPANLTNSLKQRARTLGLERPWVETVSPDDRTVWVDRDRIAQRMVDAIRNEQQRRLGP